MKRFAPALVALAFLPLLLPSGSSAGESQLLINGGFESGTTGWSWNDGTLEVVTSPVHSGTASGRFAADAQPDTPVTVHQSVAVVGGQSYEFGGWTLLDDPNVARADLSITWLTSGDPIGPWNSTSWLSGPVPNFRYLTTGKVTAPLSAQAAKVSMRVIPEGNFAVYFDDFSFVGPTPAPAPTPAPSATAPATPTATPPPFTVSPTPRAATNTPTPPVTPTLTPSAAPANPTPPPATTEPHQTPLPAPTPPDAPIPTVAPPPQEPPAIDPTLPASTTPTPTPIPEPTTEPLVFGELANTGFEQTRADGTPYAWRKFGGSYRSSNSRSLEGGFSLEFTSSTESTKWVYQTLEIVGGAHYEASVYALKDHPSVEGVFLRVSFYESDDGSGRAISAVDSLDTLTNDDPEFHILTTGTVQAPLEARTAKVRLMMRPTSNALATSYFDSVSFRRAAAPPGVLTPTEGPEIAQEVAETTPRIGAEAPPAGDRDHETVPPSPSSAVLGVESTPITLANVRPPQKDAGPAQPESPGRGYNLLLILAITLPAIGLGAVGLSELRRNRPTRD